MGISSGQPRAELCNASFFMKLPHSDIPSVIVAVGDDVAAFGMAAVKRAVAVARNKPLKYKVFSLFLLFRLEFFVLEIRSVLFLRLLLLRRNSSAFMRQ